MGSDHNAITVPELYFFTIERFRIMNAKKILYNSIYKLMQENRIEKITVDMILKESEVSRATFYRHFRDKFDLINWYHASFVEKELFHSDQSWEQIIYKAAVFMLENKHFYFKAVKFQGQNSLNEFILKYYTSFVEARYKKGSGQTTLSVKEQLAIAYHCSGAVRIFNEWVSGGMAIPPEELTDYFCDLIHDELRKVLE